MPDLTPPPASRWRVLLDALPLTALIVLVLSWNFTASPQPEQSQALRPIYDESAQALEALYRELDYSWPPTEFVPRLALQQLPADLAELPVASRKALFFSSLTPLVLAENERLLQKRARLQDLLARPTWSDAEQQELAALAERYAVSGDLTDAQIQEWLLQRIDAIPLGLALAQAAKESGWGTSRFAQEARNLFGVWTWDSSQGLVPAARSSGATHLVRIFPDLQASVRNYLHTLNIGAAYTPLRQQRAYLRSIDAPLRPLDLVDGLVRYSERGQDYVQEVRTIILSNQLHRLDELKLAP